MNRAKSIITLFILTILSLMISCKESEKEKNTSNKQVETTDIRQVDIKYFEEDFFGLTAENFETDLKNLEPNYPVFFYRQTPVDYWKERFDNKKLKNLSDSLNILFKKESWKKEFNQGINNYKNEFANDILPELVFWNSGFEMNEGVWDYDNVLLIAMEHYLGKEHPFYFDTPSYIAKQKEIGNLPVDLFLAFAKSKLKIQKDVVPTFLDKIILEGKALYFTERMLDYSSKNDDKLLKYDSEKVEWCNKNEAEIWKHFITKEYLFSSDNELDKRFIQQAPFSKFYLTFDKESPGRIGAWIGLQVIRSYMESNPNIPLETLMMLNDSQKLLTLSKYKPQN